MRRRYFFKPNVPCHVYSRGFKSFCIFYDLSDFLVFTSIYYYYSRKYGIRTIALCLMINHYHCVVLAPSKTAFSRFIQTVESVFAKRYNEAHKRSGPVFWRRFGWAPKEIGKRARSCITYVMNNPVAGKLCKTALEYKWNYLAYFNNSNPHSTKYVRRKSSRRMVRTVDYWKAISRGGAGYLGYQEVGLMFKDLNPTEVQQLTDLLVSHFNPIDYEEMIKYYGSYEDAILAMKANTGDEHDLKEDWDDYSVYRRMLAVTRQNGHTGMVNFEAVSDQSELRRIIDCILSTGANKRQIRKFLHL